MIRYVHGSEDSLDIDVFYVFDEMPSFQECQTFCANKEENRNIIVVNNGIVTECFKGTVDEVNNGLYHTYNLHEQKYPLIINQIVERDVLIKAIRVMRCLLTHCSKTQYRDLIKETLKSSSWKKRIETLKTIDFSTIDDYGKHGTKQDVFKIFAFQLGQMAGLANNKELYTKSSISNEFKFLKNMLYRNSKGCDINILNFVINKFIEYTDQYQVQEENNLCYFSGFDKKIDLIKEHYINDKT